MTLLAVMMLSACGSSSGDATDGSGPDAIVIGDAGGDVGLPDGVSPDGATPDADDIPVDLPPCTTNADCRGGELCVDDLCREACADNDPCRGELTVCDQEDGVCGVCAGDADCTNGRGCEAGFCTGGCTTDASCGADSWCDSGTCRDQVCDPGSVSCEGAQIVTCNARGSSSTTESCTGACDDTGAGCTCIDGACEARVCLPGASRCAGAGVQTCLEDGSAFGAVVACPAETLCTSGACLPTSCSAGESFCAGTQLFGCDGGVVTLNRDCADRGERCVGESGDAQCEALVCTPDEVFCVDATTVGACNALGSELSEIPCADGDVCEAGACVDVVSECVTPTLTCTQLSALNGPAGESLPYGYYYQCQAGTVGGRPVREFVFSLVEQPFLSFNMLEEIDGDTVYIVPDSDGDYEVSLSLTDTEGNAGCTPVTYGFNVDGGEDPVEPFSVEISWVASAVSPAVTTGVDIDLHLLWVGTGCWGSTTADCHWKAKTPDWGVVGDPSDNPRMTDDSVTGDAPEVVEFNRPDPTQRYAVGVEYYGDAGTPRTATVSLAVRLGARTLYETNVNLVSENTFWLVGLFNPATGTFTPNGSLYTLDGPGDFTGVPCTF